MSSYIFILVVELLACALKFDPNINGIDIDESEFLIIQYADDTTLLLDDNEVSLNSALNLTNAFSETSGLKVNFEKTQAVWIGAKRGCVEEIKTEKPLCRNPKCSNVAKCSNYYILPCTCIGIYRQNVVIYYKTGYHFLTSVALM